LRSVALKMVELCLCGTHSIRWEL